MPQGSYARNGTIERTVSKMERLTIKRRLPQEGQFMEVSKSELSQINDASAEDIYRKLQAYEDTGLTPEDVKALIAAPNIPLTLEELCQMNKLPVWIEANHQEYRTSMWGIVSLCPPPDIAEPQVIMVTNGVLHFEQVIPYPKQKKLQLYGRTWFAYRRQMISVITEGEKENA